MDPKVLKEEKGEFFIQQFFTGCLAEMAYYIESNKVAAMIDPMRDYQQYLDLATSRGATIKYVFETHFHADFISSHLDLARLTGATIIYGPTASPNYEIRVAADEEEIQIGAISLKVLHTPGHTPESSCFLLLDSEKTPKYIFSGDTVFLGDVGRPDLACNSTLTKEDLAATLYKSLRTKIFPLPRDIVVYPAHGAGSSCGKNISDGTFDTLENQFKTNWALQESLTEEEFVSTLVKIKAPPQYYFYDAKVNREGYESLDTFIEKSYKPLNPAEVKDLIESGSLVIDGRSNAEFLSGYIAKSFFLSLGMPFAQWIGTLIAPETKIILLTPPGKEKEAAMRLARIGYPNVQGYLNGGINAWKDAGFPLATQNEINATDFMKLVDGEGCYAIDVRKPEELQNHGSVKTLEHLELNFIEAELTKNPDLFPRDKDIYVMCRSGQRSVVAMSIMKRFGYSNLINVGGGFIAVQSTNSPSLVVPE